MRDEARVAVRLLLQHHPLCGWFASDRIRIGPLTVCSGCLAAAPAACVGLAVGLVLAIKGTPAEAVVAGGLVFGLPQLTTYLHRGTRGWRFAVKLLGGFGLGALLGGALFLPVSNAWLVGGAVLLAATFVGLQAVRVRSILATCDACPYRRDWDACPGFRVTPPQPASGSAEP
ncbi:MAG: hypothetical protein AABY18_02545 [Candidatus Thermoplasmatota archaeon]